ncbi:hypothetical protein ASG90_08620 [Nocardioides sp. Soil797]|nr:hypothetical protein ASG90_08620 [Nocardioides sp. Soil797]
MGHSTPPVGAVALTCSGTRLRSTSATDEAPGSGRLNTLIWTRSSDCRSASPVAPEDWSSGLKPVMVRSTSGSSAIGRLIWTGVPLSGIGMLEAPIRALTVGGSTKPAVPVVPSERASTVTGSVTSTSTAPPRSLMSPTVASTVDTTSEPPLAWSSNSVVEVTPTAPMSAKEPVRGRESNFSPANSVFACDVTRFPLTAGTQLFASTYDASTSRFTTPRFSSPGMSMGNKESAGGFALGGAVTVWFCTGMFRPATAASRFLDWATALSVAAALSTVLCEWARRTPARSKPATLTASSATSACAEAAYGAGSGSACAAGCTTRNE